MRGWTLISILTAAGAGLGLIIASLVNSNCDSFLEAAAGCTRLDVGTVTGIGAAIGVLAGLLVAAARG